MKFLLSFATAVLLNFISIAQCLSPVNFMLQKEVAASATPLYNHDMSAKRDSAPSKPYLYVAGKEQGLRIYDISNTSNPALSASISVNQLNNLDVNSITQVGPYLYLALGNIFDKNSQSSGMAIINVSTPATPIVTSVYSFSSTSGTGHVAVEGNYAFLAANQNGILVIDISNKSNPVFVSQFKPSIHFPKPNPNTSEQDKINARSMVVKNNIIYLCYDAGGVRIINATNKNNLVETGQYSNPLLLTRPRAYNNLVLNDSLVYVAADYCGMEVLKIKDTSNIIQVGWWNPWKCETSANTWFNSPGHTNEIEFDPDCKLLFMSAGRTDIIAVSVANPAFPDSCSQFGTKLSGDTLGTWGLGRYQNQIYLAYISTWPFYIPFTSKWSGIKILNYNNSCTTGMPDLQKGNFLVYPNPSNNGSITIKSEGEKLQNVELVITDVKGTVCYKNTIVVGEESLKLNLPLENGFYFISFNTDKGKNTRKLVINK